MPNDKKPAAVAIIKKEPTAVVAKTTTAIPRPKQNVTQVIIKYDVGFGNTLSIRGQGAPGLSWNKGVPLKNLKSNEWIWEINATFALAEYKVLINDKIYETGPNHSIKCGASTQYSPRF